MDLEFTRGDTQFVKFQLKDLNNNILQLTSDDILYFTMKQNSNSEEVLLQKKYPLDIEIDSEGYYGFEIGSEDTSELPYGQYQYDIELKSGSYVKTLALGTITLTEEITFRRNE